MSNIQAQVPALSLGGGALFSSPINPKREVYLRSTQQPPGWIFQVAWILQAILLGFAGQGIGSQNDAYLKNIWLAFSVSLGPLQAISTWMRATPRVPLNWALVQDFTQVVGLLVLLLLVVVRSYQVHSEYNYFLWPTVAWISFALFLVSTAQLQQNDPNVRRARTNQLLKQS